MLSDVMNLFDMTEVCALDMVGDAFNELKQRSELKDQFERVSGVVNRLGY